MKGVSVSISPSHDRPRGGRRSLGAALLALLTALGTGTAGAQGTDPGADDRPESRLPPYLVGVDLDLPSQEAFRDWPPDALVERPYWLGWGLAAFRRAALFDRPVLFVMTVRWNRTAWEMATGTLADGDVLRAINERFASILVNADRRPDIALRYATGAWPVIAFLNHDGTPMLSQANEEGNAKPITIGPVGVEPMRFFLTEGAVYHEKWGSFLIGLGNEWARREGEVTERAGAIDEAASDVLARWLLANADREDGGFGVAPKFLVPGLTEYAELRAARQVPALRPHAETTLRSMVASPLFDASHGGLHRLAASPGWTDLQYEKLLDRNTALVRELLFGLRRRDDPALRAALDGTVGFLLEVLARPGGGFYLAQCADPQSADGGGWWRGETPADDVPPVDRLVLAGPNAEAGATLLRAGARTGNDAWSRAGREALALVLGSAVHSGSGVRHVIEPSPREDRFLVTQAEVAFALLDAYESTGDRSYLAAARDLADFAIANLLDSGETAFRDRLRGVEEIGLLANTRRPLRENARMARALLRLAVHGQGEAYRDQALGVLSAFSGDLSRYGVQGTEAALGIEEAIRPPLVLRVEGAAGAETTRTMRKVALGAPWPWTVVTTGDDGPEAIPAVVAVFGGEESRLESLDALAAFLDHTRSLLPAEDAP